MSSPGYKALGNWRAPTPAKGWAAILAGWPLPTLADGPALHRARTKQFSAVGSKNTRKATVGHERRTIVRLPRSGLAVADRPREPANGRFPAALYKRQRLEAF